ncbi:MAG: hypothetical protein RLZZ172_338 [Bacteroidota bacterium]|jgi:hypothetical protein
MHAKYVQFPPNQPPDLIMANSMESMCYLATYQVYIHNIDGVNEVKLQFYEAYSQLF